MSECISGAIGVCFGFVFGFLIASFIGYKDVVDNWNREAVKVGAAEYKADENGYPVFTWRNTNDGN